MGALKSKVGSAFSGTPAATGAQASTVPDNGEPLSLSAITNTYLLPGRYADGEQQLRRYLAKYPNDRAAQNLLRQLTVDPKVALGATSRSYVVQAGDSYSTLAARDLGDSSQFLVLARYNGSTNPSTLRAGETIRLPSISARASSRSSAKETSTSVATTASTSNATPSNESPAAKAQRLQAESTALLRQGQKDQAMARLDEALTLDPHVKPAGDPAVRAPLLASYHERAVVLYRDQKLDQAIALWDRILAVDPGYERAVIYRARALELQHRLNQI
ncbi:LysM peptidoglycan-binding domain-containing protein [Dyella telluris]|uniref:LysM peptidoglycan-binding domain-containing protein n=1 Tax=Dyella telluris TaxID=2763498 RepID=UPI001EE57C0B|nr:LysM domain-containing protein [Dyella telluris]